MQCCEGGLLKGIPGILKSSVPGFGNLGKENLKSKPVPVATATVNAVTEPDGKITASVKFILGRADTLLHNHPHNQWLEGLDNTNPWSIGFAAADDDWELRPHQTSANEDSNWMKKVNKNNNNEEEIAKCLNNFAEGMGLNDNKAKALSVMLSNYYIRGWWWNPVQDPRVSDKRGHNVFRFANHEKTEMDAIFHRTKEHQHKCVATSHVIITRYRDPNAISWRKLLRRNSTEFCVPCHDPEPQEFS